MSARLNRKTGSVDGNTWSAYAIQYGEPRIPGLPRRKRPNSTGQSAGAASCRSSAEASAGTRPARRSWTRHQSHGGQCRPRWRIRRLVGRLGAFRRRVIRMCRSVNGRRQGRIYSPEGHLARVEACNRTKAGATWPEGIRCTLSGSEFVALRARHRCRPSVQKQSPRSAYPWTRAR